MLFWDYTYDVWFWFLIILILGIISYKKHKQKFETGQISGVKTSKHFFDWLFYHQVD